MWLCVCVCLCGCVMVGCWFCAGFCWVWFRACQLAFMFVELVVGWWTNSLGLISDAGHMFFDNASLFIGLYASYMAKWRQDEVFTYGYVHTWV